MVAGVRGTRADRRCRSGRSGAMVIRVCLSTALKISGGPRRRSDAVDGGSWRRRLMRRWERRERAATGVGEPHKQSSRRPALCSVCARRSSVHSSARRCWTRRRSGRAQSRVDVRDDDEHRGCDDGARLGIDRCRRGEGRREESWDEQAAKEKTRRTRASTSPSKAAP
ncbi:hypothetical protein AAT19DRAFT_13808 [Rhodotorula toruloides]|uniref:Uncharacterized protein n=1 Tax=Rhodotorula toruloides TaxID=5286 RepID=A0A2T0AA14_RHOTO|nr:hypothetical protein AAT19DRAFT_13808 [Rhodotorula toruloides]